MNAKLLFVATLVIAVLSSVAMAGELSSPASGAPALTRAQVRQELAQAIASGALQRSDYASSDVRPVYVRPTQGRWRVREELANAIASGTLRRSDYETATTQAQ